MMIRIDCEYATTVASRDAALVKTNPYVKLGHEPRP